MIDRRGSAMAHGSFRLRVASRYNALDRPCEGLRTKENFPGQSDDSSDSGDRLISRQWRGLAKADQAQSYVKHLREETFPALRALPGFVGASILSRDVGGGVEFLIITQWRALEDIAGFSGPDLDAAVVPPEVAQLMIEFDCRVRHYEIIE
jgi:hypothetical protein